MQRYQPGSSRTVFGLAAVFMTAATLAVTVVAPASMAFSSRQVGVQTLASDTQHEPAANVALPTNSVNVVALRRTLLVPVVHSRAQARHGIQS
jgi:hypothetical protein